MRHLAEAGAVLDVDTGGGEFLLSITGGLPPVVHATEGHAPNLRLARTRLEPLGVPVAEVRSGDPLPYPKEAFDLILNRHGSVRHEDVARCLCTNGWYVTQQVGWQNNHSLAEMLGAHGSARQEWDLETAAGYLEQAGLRIVNASEEHPVAEFKDVGAVVMYLRAVPWELPGKRIEDCGAELRRIHEIIQRTGALTTRTHRFVIEACAG